MQRRRELRGGRRRARAEAQQQQRVELQHATGLAGRGLAERRLLQDGVDAAQRVDRLARHQHEVGT